MCLPVLSRGKEGEITPWLEWFLDCLNRAFDKAETILAAVLKKAPFWEVHGATAFNERRRKILNELLNGFEGKLTSSKWAKLARWSQDTALREIEDLVRSGERRGRGSQHQLFPGGLRRLGWTDFEL
jgi:Fic family protein